MVTLSNYNKTINNSTLELFPQKLKDNHLLFLELAALVAASPEILNDISIKTELTEHLKLVNEIVYPQKSEFKNENIEVSKIEFKQSEPIKTIRITDIPTENVKDNLRKFAEIINLNEAKETEQKENQLKSNTYNEPIKQNEPIKSIIETIGSNALTSIKEILSPKRDNNLIDTIKDYSYLFKNTQLKDEIIQQRINNSGLSNSRIMHKCGVSYATFYKYRIALEGCGLIPSDWETKNKAGRPKIY